jgi:DNA polymerase-3 subunit alpha (Gram-positive type)
MEDNLLKLDELGHDDPTMIRMLEDLTGVNAREIRLDDPDTMAIFRSPAPLGLPDSDPVIGKTGTIGIPEFGTGFTRQMLVDTRPEDFDTLVRLSGFSHGTDVWAGNIRDLILSGTATVKETVGCRDDIMLYLISKGMDEKRAFKFMEAVRKGAIHKGKAWPEGIEAEMRSLGVPDWYIESCRKIQYLFPKAHAVAYVMMAFRIAWFKVHEPLAFTAPTSTAAAKKTVLTPDVCSRESAAARQQIRQIRNNPAPTAKEADLLTTLEAVYEFYLRGFDFEPIDLYQSDATRFLIEGEEAASAFCAIPGLGEAPPGPGGLPGEKKALYIHGRAFRRLPKGQPDHLEQLKALGALGDMPETSRYHSSSTVYI